MEPHDETLSATPGTQAGWAVPLYGLARCQMYGHELEHRCEYDNGLIVGYCCRCATRVEIPWFRGGTMAALGEFMAAEAIKMQRPAPTVITDLEQVAGLLTEDIAELNRARRDVRQAQRDVLRRIGLG